MKCLQTTPNLKIQDHFIIASDKLHCGIFNIHHNNIHTPSQFHKQIVTVWFSPFKTAQKLVS